MRLDRHVENAEKIAEYLDKNDSVKKVYYPGLKSFRGYEINKKQARNISGSSRLYYGRWRAC